MNSKDVGNLGEHIAIVELLRLGYIVSRPLGDNSRYDLIVDSDSMLYTVQIKTTNTSSDVSQYWLSSSQAHRGGGREKYDVDYIVLVDIPKSKVFILDRLSYKDKSSITIRYENRNSSCNWYEDFILNENSIR